MEGYVLWVFSTNILFPVVLPFCCKLTLGSFAILVPWFWKCLLWEAETIFHQNFSVLFLSKIRQSLVFENISVAHTWEASMWRKTLMIHSVVQKQCLKPFHALKPCHWAEKKSLHVLWEGWKAGTCLRFFEGTHWRKCVAYMCCMLHRWHERFACVFLQEWLLFAVVEFKHWCCFPRKQNEPFLLSEEVGGGVQPLADVMNHTNILMNVVWDSDGNWSHTSLTWSSVSIFPEKVPSGEKYIYLIDLPFHTHRSPKNTASTAILSPELYKWGWAEFLFSACSYSADPLRFPQMVPQPSSSFFCSSDSQLLGVFLLRKVPGIFQALSDNRVGDGCS